MCYAAGVSGCHRRLKNSKINPIFLRTVSKYSEYIWPCTVCLHRVIETLGALALGSLVEVLPPKGSPCQDHRVAQCASLLPPKNSKSITLLYVSHQNMSFYYNGMRGSSLNRVQIGCHVVVAMPTPLPRPSCSSMRIFPASQKRQFQNPLVCIPSKYVL